MIDFELTEEQKQIKALIKEFCEREIDIKYLQGLSDQAGKARTVKELRELYPHELIKKFHEVGLRQLCVPEKYGGGGYGQYHSVTRAIACEELGYHMGVGSRLLTVPYMTLTEMSHNNFTEEEKDWFFPQYMKDTSFTLAVAGTEPPAATDFTLPYEKVGEGYPVGTFASKDGDEWVINGDKMHSSSGGIADLIRVITRTDKKGPLAKSLTAFWVRKDTPGMEYTVNRLLLGEIGGNVQIIFDNVRVPESQRVMPVNGFNGNAFGGAKTMVFIDWLGHCRRVYEQVVDYAKERMGGGVPIIQHTAIAAMLGEVALHIDAARAFAYRVCWENDQLEKAGKPLLPWDSNGVNYWCRKTSGLLCDVGFEVYGGVGGDLDLELEGLVRRSYTWPQGNRTISAIKYSKAKNNHILAQQREQVEAAAAGAGLGF